MRGTLIVLACVLSAACGQSPTAPTDTLPPVNTAPPTTPASIAGAWSGRMQFTFKGTPNQWLETRVELQQTDRTITGTWIVTAPAGNDIRGEITGALEGVGGDTVFRGTVGWNSETATGNGRCFGRGSFAGPSVALLRWEASGFEMDNCTNPEMSQIVWTLTRVP